MQRLALLMLPNDRRGDRLSWIHRLTAVAVRMCRYMVIGVTPQEVAISAMVNWRASYIRWALPMRLAVILGLRPPL